MATYKNTLLINITEGIPVTDVKNKNIKVKHLMITDVEIILASSRNDVYVNDQQRIGFQKGIKYLLNRLDWEKV